jgi:hypothetical protein
MAGQRLARHKPPFKAVNGLGTLGSFAIRAFLRQESAVTEVFIRFPIHCPICKQESTSQRTKSEILDALDGNKPIRVYAECHDWHWDLGADERKQLAARAKA